MLDAVATIKHHGGQIRMSEALAAGVSRHQLHKLLEAGVLERISRGVYRLTELPRIASHDLAIVALRVPRAVVCLVSALAFHEITTQVPHSVWIALPHGVDTPRIEHPPLSVHRFGKSAYEDGIETHQLDGITAKIYSPEKTIADTFKFRNKVGMDLALEALRLYFDRGQHDVRALIHFSRVCRVENIIRPYLEALL